MNDRPSRAPDFTQACIFMFGVNVVWIFFAIWAIWGLIAVAAAGLAINRIISFLAARQR